MATEKRIVITRWSAVSPLGIGRTAFEAGFLAGAAPAAVRTPPYGDLTGGRAYLVPEFDVRTVLGRRGTRSMERLSGLAVTTARELLQGKPALTDSPQTAVVLGTAGSAQVMRDFTRSSLLAERPFYVDPAAVPNGVMNCAASRIALWHRLRGPNATLTTGRTAGLFALGHARRLLTAGRARQAVVGAAEEYSNTRAWLEWHHRDHRTPSVSLSEGCALFLLEHAADPSRPPLAELLTIEHRTCVSGPPGEQLRHCVHSALARYGLTPDDIWSVSLSRAPGRLGDHEHQALMAMFTPSTLDRLHAPPWIAVSASASAAFQLATTLTAARQHAATGRLSLIIALDPGGTMACALLRHC
ncbi:beta-ketoacyl synthase N-terminal-like domain-containing protein [Streptomyces noursei]